MRGPTPIPTWRWARSCHLRPGQRARLALQLVSCVGAVVVVGLALSGDRRVGRLLAVLVAAHWACVGIGCYAWNPLRTLALFGLKSKDQAMAKPAAISVTRTSSLRDSSITVPKMMFASG